MLLLGLSAEAYRDRQASAVQPQRLREIPRTPSTASVALRTEKQAAPGVVISYFSQLQDTGDVNAHTDVTASWRRKLSSEEWAHVQGREEAARGIHLPRCDFCFDTSARCGFTWDDAAAKMNWPCKGDMDCMPRPSNTTGSWPINASWTCYSDLPTYDRTLNGVCTAKDWWVLGDAYCQKSCSKDHFDCDRRQCDCVMEEATGIYNASAPVAPHDDSANSEDLPLRNSSLVDMVLKEAKAHPSGLPACRWQPDTGYHSKGCTNTTQYECIRGAKEGQCSGTNWFDSGSAGCEASCVHVSLLNPAPYYAVWVNGVEARVYHKHERRPHYKRETSLTMALRGILAHMDVLMSRFCRSEMNTFVGVSLFSPSYRDKATRLVKSCERNGICCKAMELPSNAFGAATPEKTDGYRFQAIALKPSFILSQLEATELPVVYLDTDLEFQRFPKLFLPNSWPSFPRDVALFNFWGNESLPKYQHDPQIGSAIAFFNATNRSKQVLTAWAEAMAYEPNAQVPDDQVLGFLLSGGGWLQRASFGWLPTSYLRLMPAFYRGVIPIVEHDHGSVPGRHSTHKPRLPPVKDMELCEPDSEFNENRSLIVSVDEYHAEVRRDQKWKCERMECDKTLDGSEGDGGSRIGAAAAAAAEAAAAAAAAAANETESKVSARTP
jgi:hypothetical protein